MFDDHYTIVLEDGKYTIINRRGRMEILRHGEVWPAARELQHTNVVRAMADRIEELETAINRVLRGAVLARNCRDDSGMGSFDEDSTVPFKIWEAQLRRVLEQK